MAIVSSFTHKHWTWVSIDTTLIWHGINYDLIIIYDIDPKYCCLKPLVAIASSFTRKHWTWLGMNFILLWVELITTVKILMVLAPNIVV